MHLDFHPGNIMKCGEDICLIDFEHCAPLPKDTAFCENPLFSKYLNLTECEIPTGGVPRFDSHWAPYTSMTKEDIITQLTP